MLKTFKIIIFIIPYHRIGGAERVHLEIIKSLKYKPIVIFDNSEIVKLSDEYKKNAFCFFLTSSKRRLFAIRVIKFFSYIFSITLFGCNSKLFYTLISKFKKRVKTVDLTHAFSYPEVGMEKFSLKFISLIDFRIVINYKTLVDYKNLYNDNNISEVYLERFRIIPNGISIYSFKEDIIEERFNNFTIGFVGRNSKEKRPDVFLMISDLVNKSKIKAKIIGDNFDNFKNIYKDVNYFEGCNDSKIIRNEFSEISLLIVSSSREGFPLVIMEAMELGIPVISSNVGSVSEHITNNHNGYISSDNSEDGLIKFVTSKIELISNDKELYNKLALNARGYAENNFNITTFRKVYKELLNE